MLSGIAFSNSKPKWDSSFLGFSIGDKEIAFADTPWARHEIDVQGGAQYVPISFEDTHLILNGYKLNRVESYPFPIDLTYFLRRDQAQMVLRFRIFYEAR